MYSTATKSGVKWYPDGLLQVYHGVVSNTICKFTIVWSKLFFLITPRPNLVVCTALIAMKPTVCLRMEPLSCTKSSSVPWMSLSWCCGPRVLVAKATLCVHTASATLPSETWRKVRESSDSQITLFWSDSLIRIPSNGV